MPRVELRTPEEIQDKIEIAWQSLLSLRGHFGDPRVMPETVFAIGIALGNVARARDLLKRDIEAAKEKAQ